MKKYLGWLIVIAGIVCLSMSGNAAARDLKIGYFDANGAAVQSQWGKRIIDDIKREQERLAADLDAKGKTFKAAKEDFDKKKDVMDEKARTRKQKELQDMATDLERQAGESSQKFNQNATAAKKPLFDKMTEIVNRIGKDDKYDFIFEKGALHYATEKDDLTKRIAAELDKGAPR